MLPLVLMICICSLNSSYQNKFLKKFSLCSDVLFTKQQKENATCHCYLFSPKLFIIKKKLKHCILNTIFGVLLFSLWKGLIQLSNFLPSFLYRDQKTTFSINCFSFVCPKSNVWSGILLTVEPIAGNDARILHHFKAELFTHHLPSEKCMNYLSSFVVSARFFCVVIHP